ncbi:multiple C2 domain and transmembrane region protein isoform X2 [Lasioglossum baleicum]|uniref:multiple C2 domain and transmembrane region protein isoform X2 n=1 Tax=Lasioglossum baleicum TaxID=434251 RepID=UPI003FCCF50D
MSSPREDIKPPTSNDSVALDEKTTNNGVESNDPGAKESSENRSIDPPKPIVMRIDPEPMEIQKPARRLFHKRGKVGDIIASEPSVDLENHSRSSRSFKVIVAEENTDSKLKKFWELQSERFKHKLEDNASKKQSEDASNLKTVEADAIFRKAIKDMRFDLEDRGSSSLDLGSFSKISEESSVEEIQSSIAVARSKAITKVEDCDLTDNVVIDRDSSKKLLEEDSAQNEKIKEEEGGDCRSTLSADSKEEEVQREKMMIDRSKDSDLSARRWSSLENLPAKDLEESKSLKTEVPEKPKFKEKIGTLKSSLERKMGSVERMLEDHVERILEENVEKHPWLLPIESWIAEHCKHDSLPKLPDRRIAGQKVPEKTERSKIEPSYDIKFTAAESEHEEPKIDSRMENLRKGRTTTSVKAGFDAVHLISKLKRSESASQKEENNTAKENGVVEMRDARHHDLFDKFKDNVREKMEDIHRYFQRTNRLADVNRRLKSQIWSSVVTIVLVEAKNLLPMDIDGLSDPYVKFRLGTEKYKSKVVHKTLNPVWLEQFDLHLYEDPYLGQELEVTVWDRDKSHQDDLMGRTVIDLATLERETTHRLWRDLEDGSGNVFLLLTISGTTASETISDLAAHEDTPREREQLYHRYSIMNTLQRVRDVGHLTVKVFRAQGLAAADLGGKSDPFCVLELVNARLQTQTEYKTLAPNWQKIFTFNVKDINSVLEVTVYDEDRDHKVEFLGKVAIPLLRIRNGEKRWYALKDKKLRGRAKGNSPQILLEMTVLWNMIRACARTLNPKEKKYMEPEIKFKRQVFLRNVLRLKAIIIYFIDIGKYVQSCWEWESKMRSIIALVIFIFGCYYFEPYMIPGAALLILLKYYLVAVITGTPLTHHTSSNFNDEGDDGPATPGDDDDDDDDKDKEEKKSLKERLQAIQEVTQTVQNSIGYIASLCERVKNLFNFTVPYLSYVAIVLVILGAVVLYFIPVRYLILAWGINKFFRKVIRPHSVPNNEVLDLISRVPDDEELLNYRELKPLPTADCERAGTSGLHVASSLSRREQRKRHKAA